MSREAAGPSPVEPAADGPVFVESGTFRVDPVRAIEVLRTHQLPDPRDFLLPWIRCAVISGPQLIRLYKVPGGLAMRFDGAPLPASVLQDPLSALFGEHSDSDPGLHLAVGILAALRLEPAFVSLTSGEGAERRNLVVSRSGGVVPEHGPEPGTGTVLAVGWGWLLPRSRGRAALERAKTRIDLANCSFRVYDDLVESHRRLAKNDPVLSGWAEALPPWRREGCIRLYKFGALVEEVPWPGRGRRAVAHVSHAKFRLNISHSGVARDSAFKEALALAVRESERFAVKGQPEEKLSPRPRVRGALLAFLDAAALCAVSFVAYRYIRSFDLPPLPGQVEEWFRNSGEGSSPVYFIVIIAAALLWLVPGYLRLTGRIKPAKSRDSSGLLAWTLIGVPVMGLLLWIYIERFQSAIVGGERVELRYYWPRRAQIALKDILYIKVVRNNGYDSDDRRLWVSWWLEVETRGGERHTSDIEGGPGHVVEFAERLSRGSGEPVTWYAAYEGSLNDPIDRERAMNTIPGPP